MDKTNMDVLWKPVGKKAIFEKRVLLNMDWEMCKRQFGNSPTMQGRKNPSKSVCDGRCVHGGGGTVQTLKIAAKSCDIQDLQCLPSLQRDTEVKEGTPLLCKELQSSAGGHDGHISSTFWWFDCYIADSSLLPFRKLSLYIRLSLYIQYPKFYIHTSTLTIKVWECTEMDSWIEHTQTSLHYPARVLHDPQVRWDIETDRSGLNCAAVTQRGHTEAEVSTGCSLLETWRHVIEVWYNYKRIKRKHAEADIRIVLCT